MNWKSFFMALAAAAAVGAERAVSGQLPQDPTQKVAWKNIGNAALLGALLGAIAHIGAPAISGESAASSQS